MQLLLVTGGQATEKPSENFCRVPVGTVCTCSTRCVCFGWPFPPFFLAADQSVQDEPEAELPGFKSPFCCL